MMRKELTLRRVTTQCQKSPVSLTQTLVNLVLFVRKKCEERQYPFGSVFAADETAVFIYPSGRTCVTNIGAKEAAVRSTDHEKLHIMVMLRARDDGKKCLPFVLLPRKQPIIKVVEKYKKKLILSWSGIVWMNQETIVEFIQKVIGNVSFHNRLLIWDSFTSHKSDQTKAELRKMKIDLAVIPSGCIKYLQPPDVCWNKPCKQKN